MEVSVPDVRRRIGYVSYNFVLKSLHYRNFARFCASTQLYAIGPHRSSSGESGNVHVTATVFSSGLRHSFFKIIGVIRDPTYFSGLLFNNFPFLYAFSKFTNSLHEGRVDFSLLFYAVTNLHKPC